MEGYSREVQMVHSSIAVGLHYADLRGHSRLDQEGLVKDFLSAEMSIPFDITQAGLWRMAAFHMDGDELVFVFQCHHAIIDGWSDALFMTELNNLYLELGSDISYRPSVLSSSYRDFIIEHEVNKRDVSIRDFWKEELAGYERLSLFSEESDVSIGHYHLSKDKIARLESFAKDHNTTVKAVSMSAYLYLLQVLSLGREDIVTGLVSHMRPSCEDSDRLLGCFLNTIPFKIDVFQDISGEDLISSVHEKLIGLKDKERLSMLDISMLHQQSGRQGNPFFDVLFDYVDFHEYGSVAEDISIDSSYEDLSDLAIGGIDLTNTFLDFMINRTGGLSIN